MGRRRVAADWGVSDLTSTLLRVFGWGGEELEGCPEQCSGSLPARDTHVCKRMGGGDAVGVASGAIDLREVHKRLRMRHAVDSRVRASHGNGAPAA